MRAVVALGAILAFLHYAGTTIGCAFESRPCAEGGSKASFGGRVFTRDGRPVPHVRVDVVFETARQAHARQPSVVADGQGRFCFRRPLEIGEVSTTAATSSLPRDPRFSDRRVLDERFANPLVVADRSPPYQPTHAPVVVASPSVWLLSGDQSTFVTHTPKLNTPADRADRCPAAKEQPGWNQLEDAETNWRSLLIYGLAAAAVLLFAASRFVALQSVLRKASVAAFVAELGLIALVWTGTL